MKTCTHCGIEKPLSDFAKDNRRRGLRAARSGQGVQSQCRLCLSEKRKPGLQQEREQKAKLAQSGFKICGKCKKPKPFSDFHKRIASHDGLAMKCKNCVNVDSEVWRNKNPNAHAEWYEKNKDHKAEYFKVWRTEHADSEPERIALWARANPHKVTAKGARRNAAKLRAIPGWADHDAIELIYAEAARLRRETGKRYEVDHAVPLQGKTVCGLHWEGNLQILTEFENISKHNRTWPDMPT